MTDYTGSGLYISFANTVLTTDYREFEDDEETALEDVSAGGDTARSYLSTLTDGTAKLMLLDQTGGTAATAPWNLMAPTTRGTLIWGPEGTATGKPKYTVNDCVVQKRNRKLVYDKATELSFDLQFSSAVQSATW